MLLQMRNFTRSWIAYLLLFVLVIAFAIWGINDVFRGVNTQRLAKVGSYEITPAQLTRELQLFLRGQRANDVNMTQQEAIDAGLHRRLLESMVGRFSLYAYADKLNVSAGNRQLAEAIRSIPNVRNQVTGQFDRTAYAAFLQELGYTQPEFERDMRGDMTSQLMINALVTGTRAPSSFGALALIFQTETREVTIAEGGASAVGPVAPPSEAQLQAFYEENAEALRVPEYRALTLVVARPQDFVSRVQVPEDQLAQELEARRATLATPERRTFVRIAAPTQAQAEEAAQRLSRGEPASEVAQALGLQATRGENQPRSEVADPQVAEAVFSMAPGAPARVVRGRLSPFVVVKVESVTPGREPDTAEIREQLRQQIALEMAADLLNEAIGAFQDTVAGGTPIAQAARQHGLTVIGVEAVDERGRDRADQPVPALEGMEEPLRAAFETQEGEATDFLPSDIGDVMVSVDRVFPASVRPLAEVRDELEQAWIARERANRLRALGQEVVQAVNAGASFADAARARGLRIVVDEQTINRQAATQIPARALASQIFQASEGDAVSDLRVDGQAVLVALVGDINRIDPAEAPQLVEAARAGSEDELAESFVETLQAEMRRRVDPEINERLLQQVFRSSDAAQEQ